MISYWFLNGALYVRTASSSDNFEDRRLSVEADILLLSPFTLNELYAIVTSQNIQNSVGSDKIPKRFLKKGTSILYGQLADLFTESAAGGLVINKNWLTFKGLYLHRGGDPSNLDTHRAILLNGTLRSCTPPSSTKSYLRHLNH